MRPVCSCAASYQFMRDGSAFLLSMDVARMLLKLEGWWMTTKMSDNEGIGHFHKAQLQLGEGGFGLGGWVGEGRAV